jgi:hypothetical protein
MRDEIELEEPSERSIDTVAREAEGAAHALAPVEGRPAPVSCQGEQDD